MASTAHEPANPTSEQDEDDGDTRQVERQLIAKAVRRDASAFASLYDLHVVRVYRHIYYLVANDRDSEDLTAQTFLKAWEAIGRYRDRGAPFVAWLLRIAHNVAISHIRARRAHSALDESYVDQQQIRNPEEALDRLDEEGSVREALLNLRDEQRQVLMLRFVEELDYAQVAKLIGKSVPAVRVIQHRALGNLRKIIRI
jgi:RNA polymerase sigma-70 factor (ECF subfamily)